VRSGQYALVRSRVLLIVGVVGLLGVAECTDHDPVTAPATTSTVTASTGTTPTSAAPKCVASGEAAAVVPDVIGLILPDAIAMVQSAGPNVVDGGVGQRSGMTPERREVAYEVDSTTLVTTQRCLPILRSRTNPSFS